MQTKTGLSKLIAKIGLVVGSLVLIVGLVLVGKTVYQLSNFQRTDGVAVAYDKGMKGHWPHVQFTVGQRQYVVSSYVETEQERGVKKGDTVVVYYPADAPAEGRLDLALDNWLGPGITTAVGLGFIIISFLLGLGHNRR